MFIFIFSHPVCNSFNSFSPAGSTRFIPFKFIPAHSISTTIPSNSFLPPSLSKTPFIPSCIHAGIYPSIRPSIHPCSRPARQPNTILAYSVNQALSYTSDSVIYFHSFRQFSVGDPDQLEAGKRHVSAGRQALDQPRLASSYHVPFRNRFSWNGSKYQSMEG